MIPVYIQLTNYQKQKLAQGYKKKNNIKLKTKIGNENDFKVYVNKCQYDKLLKNKPMVLGFNRTHYSAMKNMDGGSILSSLLPMATKMISKVAPVVTKQIIPGVLHGLTSTLSSVGVDKLLSGNGISDNVKDIIIVIDKLIQELNKLKNKDRKQFDEIMLSGSNYVEGGFLGCLLSSLSIGLLLKSLGAGIHNSPEKSSYKEHNSKIPIQVSQTDNKGTALVNNKWQPYDPYNAPKFYDDYEIKGYGKKKSSKISKSTRLNSGEKFSFQGHSIIEFDPVMKFKDSSTSNIDLENWIDYLKLRDKFAGIYSHDQITKDIIESNKGKFFILNLDISKNEGTHWVCFYNNKNQNIIEYFDSYGLPPINTIINNFNYIYNSNQYQSYQSKACGYYCIYYIYKRYNGESYYNIIKKFSLTNLYKNQEIIKNFFNNSK